MVISLWGWERLFTVTLYLLSRISPEPTTCHSQNLKIQDKWRVEEQTSAFWMTSMLLRVPTNTTGGWNWTFRACHVPKTVSRNLTFGCLEEIGRLCNVLCQGHQPKTCLPESISLRCALFLMLRNASRRSQVGGDLTSTCTTMGTQQLLSFRG